LKRFSLLLLIWLWSPAIAAPAPDPSQLAGISTPLLARAPMDLVFTDQHGRRITLGAIADGEPLLLVPVQHNCRNLCGLTLENLATVLADAGLRPGGSFRLVAFGIDPRETSADASHSAARMGGENLPGVEALVGGAAGVARVTGALGYRYTWIAATGQYAHMSAIAVLGPDGRLVRWFAGLGENPAALKKALAAARTGQADDLGGQIRLLCFHFDPATGRYTLAVWRLLQWAAGAAAAALAGAIGTALWRGRGRGAAA
jgi:protein SCO1/2